MTESEWLTSNNPEAMLRSSEREWDEGAWYSARDRKLRLFACAFLLMGDGHPHTAELASAAADYADGILSLDEIRRAWRYHIPGISTAGPEFPLAWCYSLFMTKYRWSYQSADVADLLREIIGNPYRSYASDRWGVAGLAIVGPNGYALRTDDASTVLALATAAYLERVEELGDHQQYERFTTRIGTTNARCLVCGYVATGEKIERNHRQFCIGSGVLDPSRLGILGDALEEAGCTEQALLNHLRGPGPHVRGCWALDLILGKG